MELDTVQNKGETGTLAGLKQAARDPLVWVFAAMAHMHLAANGFKNFVSRVRAAKVPDSGNLHLSTNSSQLLSKLLASAKLLLLFSPAHLT